MFDVVVSKGRDELELKIHTKPTVQGIPLCSTSMHSVGIHRSWPNARYGITRTYVVIVTVVCQR